MSDAGKVPVGAYVSPVRAPVSGFVVSRTEYFNGMVLLAIAPVMVHEHEGAHVTTPAQHEREWICQFVDERMVRIIDPRLAPNPQPAGPRPRVH